MKISNDEMVGDKVLYDARIKPGDEEYWYRKFEAAGFSLEDFENKHLDQKEMKAQYRANLKGLQRMLVKAEQTGKKVNGYTIIELERLVNDYTELAS